MKLARRLHSKWNTQAETKALQASRDAERFRGGRMAGG